MKNTSHVSGNDSLAINSTTNEPPTSALAFGLLIPASIGALVLVLLVCYSVADICACPRERVSHQGMIAVMAFLPALCCVVVVYGLSIAAIVIGRPYAEDGGPGYALSTGGAILLASVPCACCLGAVCLCFKRSRENTNAEAKQREADEKERQRVAWVQQQPWYAEAARKAPDARTADVIEWMSQSLKCSACGRALPACTPGGLISELQIRVCGQLVECDTCFGRAGRQGEAAARFEQMTVRRAYPRLQAKAEADRTGVAAATEEHARGDGNENDLMIAPSEMTKSSSVVLEQI